MPLFARISQRRLAALTAASVLALAACSDATEPDADPAAAAPEPQAHYTMETLVPGGPFHGIHGLTFDGEGRLLVGSVLGREIYEVDPESGDSRVFIPPPEGMADDIEEGPDGTLAWTAFSDGIVYVRDPDSDTARAVAAGLPGVNSLAFTQDGRLFFTQVFMGDALYEADITGATRPRKLMEGMGGLNGFDFGPDGHLYGPLWFKGQIVRVDVDAETPTPEVVAEGFTIPAAANFDSQGTLYAVDTAEGAVVRVDIETGATEVVARTPTAIDNLAFSADDRLFLTVMADNAVHEVDVTTGAVRDVVSSPLTSAADLALVTVNGRETLYVADVFALRSVDLETGAVSEIGRVFTPPAGGGDAVDYPLMLGTDGTRMVMTSWASASVQTLDPETGALGPLHHGFGAILDALPDGEDVLYLDVLQGALMRASGPDFSTRTTVAMGLAEPVSLLRVDPETVYVSLAASGQVVAITLADGAMTLVAEGLNRPEGIALDGDGRLIVAETGAQRLIAIDLQADDNTPIILAEDLPLGLDGPAGSPPSYVPTGVVVTQNGDIVFSSDLDAAIYRLRKD